MRLIFSEKGTLGAKPVAQCPSGTSQWGSCSCPQSALEETKMENPRGAVQGPNLRRTKLAMPTHNQWGKAGCLWNRNGPSSILFGPHDLKKKKKCLD